MIRLGTRRSPLALAQARHVARLLGEETELVEITSDGDRDRAAPDKAKWVRALERALHEDRVDLVVHSAKDVPGELPDGLGLVGAPGRASAADALVGAATLHELEEGAVVGTASLRRAAQLRAWRSDLDVVPLRGNVDTRLAKLDAGEARALVLARAGLERLGRGDRVDAELDHPLFVPAAGQGVLALEARLADARVRDAARAVTDPPAWIALRAERAAMAALGADCTSACGAHARLDGEDRLRIALFAGTPDGHHWCRDEHEGDAADPEALGRAAAVRLARAGAAEILGSDRARALVAGPATPGDGTDA